MLYFSQLKGRKVYTIDQIEVGHLEDLIFIPFNKPKITKLIVRSIRKERLIIPLDYLVKIDDAIFIEKYFNTVKLVEEELIVGKSLLGRRIFNWFENKIKRINDIVLQDNIVNINSRIYIVGFDTGLFGFLRFFYAEKIVCKIFNIFHYKVTEHLTSWEASFILIR